MSGVGLLLTGRAVMVVGVEPDRGGCTRLYVGHRANGDYFLVDGSEAESVRRQWANPSARPVVDIEALRGRYMHTEGARPHERAVLWHIEDLELQAEAEAA